MTDQIHFKNRREAGRRLAETLKEYAGTDCVVYGLPRGGVAVAKEAALALHCPLDLLLVRKIGHPNDPEFAIGAVSESGRLFLNNSEAKSLDKTQLKKMIEDERLEAERRRNVYLGDREALSVEGKIVIIIDDGVATGLTMKAAIAEAKSRKPRKIVAAAPVSPWETGLEIARLADEFKAIDAPRDFLGSIAAYYDDFPQLKDEEVIALLKN